MRDDNAYLNEHHALTETAIGVARIHLQKGNATEAMKSLDDCCKDLDKIIIKFQPATARLMDLVGINIDQAIKGQRVKYVPDHANGDPDHPSCELGCIKRMASKITDDDLPACFVLYDNLDTKMITGDEDYTAKRTRLENLILI